MSSTSKQQLGAWGEKLVINKFSCPRCKRARSLCRLPTNFKCADVICDFCGYLAQVKTAASRDNSKPPDSILGAAWSTQRERMRAGIYFPLFVVLRTGRNFAVYYLATEFQSRALFRKRAPLSNGSKRAGWQGFRYDIAQLRSGALVRIL